MVLPVAAFRVRQDGHHGTRLAPVHGAPTLQPSLRHSLADAATYIRRTFGSLTPCPAACIHASHTPETDAWHLEVRCVLNDHRRALDTARDVREGLRAAVISQLNARGRIGSVTITRVTGGRALLHLCAVRRPVKGPGEGRRAGLTGSWGTSQGAVPEASIPILALLQTGVASIARLTLRFGSVLTLGVIAAATVQPQSVSSRVLIAVSVAAVSDRSGFTILRIRRAAEPDLSTGAGRQRPCS
ncbi:hypothetical protein ACFVJH_30070 [Streptomyces decoyicus]|uniref:hypothetical protein n=1 Tax=Streptomyces decoyicus TaxID=249567 RepID=UPI003639ECAA